MKHHSPCMACLWWIGLAVLLCPPVASAAACSAASGARRVPVLELYTSEGCDSCPPADRWLSRLAERGLGPDRVVALAFHVDYWNHLGWIDPFAKRQHAERQRTAARRNNARFVYTPQLILNGKDYRRGLLRDDFPDRVAAIHRQPPGAALTLRRRDLATPAVGVSLDVSMPRDSVAADAWIALYEDGLESRVAAGENRGRTLAHDRVVRALAGPYQIDQGGLFTTNYQFARETSWQESRLVVAAFVTSRESGDVIQALALGPCTAR